MRFSTQIRETIFQSQAEAMRLGNNFIGIEHLILGLCHNSKSLLSNLGIDLGKLRGEAEQLVKGKKLRKNLAAIENQSLPLSDLAEKVILGTVREAKARKSSVVENDDLMLSIVKNESRFNALIPIRQAIL
jgi:ATP-dependent Clp protease ATP-binding subunit ClpC